MNIHFISIGGSIMHNMALELAHQGHHVTGSDDEIYEPAYSRLKKAGILPDSMGWNTDNIHDHIDVIILGMHARIDNPELIKAQELKLTINSFPEYIYNHSKEKKRISICGSHGKTTTTSMILHVLKRRSIDTDFLVGAQLEGFERMVKLSNADILTVEGDEYLSSSIDRKPKMLHYHPHIAVITGIAWDHINVFETFDIYIDQFKQLIQTMEKGAILIYYNDDEHIQEIIAELNPDIKLIPYKGFNTTKKIVHFNGSQYDTSIFGNHNFQNMEAAFLVCQQLGINEQDFFEAIKDFKGAAKRLQPIPDIGETIAYLDFAHAPSKLEATVQAVRSMYPDKKLIAIYELHTYSSYDETFMPHYRHTMALADDAYVFIHEHSLKIKKMEMPNHDTVIECFDYKDLKILTDSESLGQTILKIDKTNTVFLFMSSGNFGGLNLISILS